MNQHEINEITITVAEMVMEFRDAIVRIKQLEKENAYLRKRLTALRPRLVAPSTSNGAVCSAVLLEAPFHGNED